MQRDKHGIQVFDEVGEPILEVGSHLIQESPAFAVKIGTVASAWAQAETNLYCLFAVLLDTTPDDAAKQLKKFNSAARATDGARKVAKDTLTGSELISIIELLDRLDIVRVRRNRIQHDVWAKKGCDSRSLYTVHANQYLSFTTNLLAINDLSLSEPDKNQRMIQLATDFAASVSNRYTVEDIDVIHQEVDCLSKEIMFAMFALIKTRLKNTAQNK